jgi:hypothetical protein
VILDVPLLRTLKSGMSAYPAGLRVEAISMNREILTALSAIDLLWFYAEVCALP